VDTAKADQSLGALIRELTREVALLFHQEVELAKTELSEKAALVGRSVAGLASGVPSRCWAGSPSCSR
jgi:hypothetical protein